jgi:hypothetical protein
MSEAASVIPLLESAPRVFSLRAVYPRVDSLAQMPLSFFGLFIIRFL